MMWARYLEQLLGLWLAASAFVLGHATLPGRLWLHDLVAAALVIGIAALAHLSVLRRIHLALLPVALWLVLHGWWHAWVDPAGGAPAFQNWMFVGLSLLMLAVVPSRASRPPASWRRLLEERTSDPGGRRPSHL